MLSTILHNNEKLLDNLVKLLSSSFDAHIQVVDLNLKPVMDYGRGAEYNALYEPIYKAVLEEKSSLYILNPRKHFVCSNCSENTRCLRKAELAFPIRTDGVICGILGMFCNTVDQKNSVCLDIDTSISRINNILSMLESALDAIADSERKELHVDIYRTAAASKGRLFVEFDSNHSIINASPEFLKHFEKKLPFFADILPLSGCLYNIEADDGDLKVKGDFFNLEIGSVFLFNIVDGEILKTTTINEEYSNDLPEIIGESEEINKLRSLAMKSAKTNSVIFISGQPGNGKENIARYIHNGSLRRDSLFIKMNCADFSGNLLYKELYGSEENRAAGKVFAADKGVLYLQNADFMPKQLLADLVRHIRGGKVVFDDYSSINIDTRLIFSSKNANLLSELSGFLKSSLGIIPVHLPPFHKIVADLSHYVRYFTNTYQNKDIVDIILSDDIINLLQGYSWPGNLTELRSVIKLIKDYYDRFSYVDEEMLKTILSSSFSAYNPDSGKSLKDIENNHIFMSVMKYGDSVYEKQLAADELGIGIATLYRKIGYKNI